MMKKINVRLIVNKLTSLFLDYEEENHDEENKC